MRYVLYFLFIIGVLFVITVVSNILNQSESYISSVSKLKIDLRNMSDSNSSIVNLDGTWNFYWNTFTQSMDNLELDSKEPTSILVPSSWNEAIAGEDSISSLGYGTYHVKVLIPEDEVEKTFGIYIPSVATSYKLWIDDEMIISNGTIATNSKEMVPVNYARTAYFQPNRDTIDVTIEVANYSQRKGGLWESIQFGYADEISLLKEKNVALQLLVVGSLVIMGIYNIFIYILRRRLVYSMFLGILCLLFAMRTLLIGETFLVNVFPAFPWELQVKFEYLPIVLGLPLLVKYVNELYPEDKFQAFEKVVILFSSIFAIIVLLTPAIVYTKYLVLFLIVVPVTLIYFGYIFLKAYFKKRPASLFTLIGFSIFIGSVINDSLYFLNFTSNGTYSSTGFLIFILSQTFVHAIKFSEANFKVEQLSDQLIEANRSLEKKVKNRTHELTLLYSKLRKSEDDRKNLMSDLSHELSKPLTLIKGYSEAIVDEKILPHKEYVQIINQNAEISERLIHDLSELSKLETRQMEMVFQKVEVRDYPYYIFQHNKWTVENQGNHFEWLHRDDWQHQVPVDAYIYIDQDRLNQVFINLIENALYYTPKGKKVYMAAEWKGYGTEQNGTREQDTVSEVAASVEAELGTKGKNIGETVIKIIDEGKGISEEEIPFIFNRLYRGNVNDVGTNSRGLGLAICKEIIDIHGGNIGVESKIGQGSIFYISLPTYRL